MSDNPFMARAIRTANITNSHRRAKKQEREIAKKIGGRITPASGARDVKGDVRIKGIIRIEAKTTKAASFSVTTEMIDKIEAAAVGSAEMPALVIEFNDGFGRKIREVAVVPMYSLQTLLENQK